MRDAEKVTQEVLKLRQRLHDKYGLYCDMALVSHILTEMLREKQGEEILGVFSGYANDELVQAAEANAELDKFGAEEEQDPPPQMSITEQIKILTGNSEPQPKRKPGRPKGRKSKN